MNSIVKTIAMGVLVCSVGISQALASGYQLNLLGQRQIGMGHVGVGLPLDLATISMNPAGLIMLDRNGLMIGGNATFLSTTFRTSPQMIPTLPGDYVATTDSPVRTPFSVYGSIDLPVENLRAGLGIYTPYGNSIRWGADWLYSALLSEITLTAIYIQPTLSYRLWEGLSVGAGLIYAIGDVNLQRQQNIDLSPVGQPADVPLSVELDGSATAFGFNLGLFYQLDQVFSLGVSYRSEIEMNVEDGDASFTLPETIPAPIAETLFPPGNTFSSSLPLPAVLSIGAGINLSPNLRLGLDANLTFWSAYETLAFDFEENTQAVVDTEEPRRFNDSWVFRIGGEWDASRALRLRLGTYVDITPVDEGYITPETPDTNRFGFSAGLGYALTPQLIIDASLLVITSSYREQSPEDAAQPGTPTVVPLGEFQNNAVIPGLAVSYRF